MLGAAEGIKLQHRLKWVTPQGAVIKLSVIQLDHAPCLDRYRSGDYSAQWRPRPAPERLGRRIGLGFL